MMGQLGIRSPKKITVMNGNKLLTKAGPPKESDYLKINPKIMICCPGS